MKTPSPADYRVPSRRTPSANGSTPTITDEMRPPWLATLDAAFKAKCRELDAANDEITKLKVTVSRLNKRLYEARQRQENWELRAQAWTRERNTLLTRLAGYPDGGLR